MASFADVSQDMLRAHNLLRNNPQHYVRMLEEEMTFFQGNVIRRPGIRVGLATQEGKPAWHEAIEDLKKIKPGSLPEFGWDDALSLAAIDHMKDIGAAGTTAHDGNDGSTMKSRIERYGAWQGTIGENLSFGAKTAEDIVAQLFVDDGVPSRGHRKNLLNPAFKILGAACGPHKGYKVGCVIDYGGGMSAKGDQKPSFIEGLIPVPAEDTQNNNDLSNNLDDADKANLLSKMSEGNETPSWAIGVSKRISLSTTTHGDGSSEEVKCEDIVYSTPDGTEVHKKIVTTTTIKADRSSTVSTEVSYEGDLNKYPVK